MTTCKACNLPFDTPIAECPSCGTEQHHRPWQRSEPPPVWQAMTAQVLERDGHQCRGLMADGSRCLTTTDLALHHIDSGSPLLASTGRFVTVCKRHAATR